jgi:hypothetical protein
MSTILLRPAKFHHGECAREAADGRVQKKELTKNKHLGESNESLQQYLRCTGTPEAVTIEADENRHSFGPSRLL